MIKVLVVDDDPICREGLRQLLSLSDDVEVVGEASNTHDAFELGQRVKPDVVLLDADLPGMACIEMIRNLTGDGSRVPGLPAFVCLAVYPDQHDAALQAGANGFLRKDAPPQELIEAIRAASKSQVPRFPLTPCEPEE